ncbi:MAG: mucoidy inhibitor MuiA family protein [Candidatus Thorarchaeota archaeon]
MKEVETRVARAVVLLDGARVTRTGKVTLPAGTHELVIRGVTGLAQVDTFRVGGRGPAVLLSIDVKSETKMYEPEDEVRRLRDQLEQLELQVKELEDRRDIENIALSQLEMTSTEYTTTLAPLLAEGQTDVDAASTFLSKIDAMRAEIQDTLRDIDVKIEDLKREIDALRENLDSVGGTVRTEDVYSIFVRVEMKKQGNLELDLTYHVSDARWTPSYDVDITSGKARVKRLAHIVNYTREDWNDVSIVVSTATSRPAKIERPEPWYIDEDRGGYLEKAPSGFIRRTLGGVTTYEVPATVTVPAGETSSPILLMEEEMEAKTLHYWYADEMAEVVAHEEVTNGDTTMIEGSVRVFREGKYVGETTMPVVAPHETFKLGARTAYDVKAEKKLRQRVVEKAGLTRGKKRRSYEYELKIENFSEQDIEIEILDRIPHSQDAEIEVRLDREGLDLEEENVGVLKWRRTVPAGEKEIITYRFEVVWDKDIIITPPLP